MTTRPRTDTIHSCVSRPDLTSIPPSHTERIQAKKAPAAKKPKAPLGEKDVNAAKPTSSSASDGKAIEDIYQKKTQLEHILLRPDTYVGSCEKTEEKAWVYCKETNKLVQRQMSFVPGLYKIFDEILVNAADNKQRDPGMDRMDVTIDAGDNTISVKNNGKGIPVEMHKNEKVSC